jgi:hypothetical protein
MILAYIFLSCIRKLNNNKNIIFLGNFISYLLVYRVSFELWWCYFKLLSPTQLVIWITILSMLLQLFFKNLVNKITRFRKNSK